MEKEKDLEKERAQAKEEYLALYNKFIKREGADKLLEYIKNSDFFTAPASTKFHSNFKGGLVVHSVNTYHRFLKIVKAEYGDKYKDKVTDESIAIISLLHDICKIDFYKEEYRNVKIDGVWESQPYFSVDEKLPYGHGEKSVYIASAYMKLTREEAMAINWHMGGFDARVVGGSYAMSAAFYKFPLAVLFHIADIEATYLDEQA